MKKDSEATKGILESTKSLQGKTEAALAHTKRMLNEETFVRQQHERTEEQLIRLNRELVKTLDQSATDNTGLHLNLRRRSELHAENRERYGGTQRDVVDITTLVEGRLAQFQTEKQGFMDALSGRMHAFVKQELDEFNAARADLQKKRLAFERSHKEVAAQTTQTNNKLN